MVQFYTQSELEQLSPDAQKALLSTERGDCYRAESKFLVRLTGHEIAPEKRDYFKALSYTNQTSHLGLSHTEVEVLGRMLSGLAEGTRFAADPSMNPRHGENAATHSLQAVISLEKLLAQSFRGLSEDKDAQKQLVEIRQFAGIGLILHDLGEILGESNTVAGSGASFEAGFDKTEMEQLILRKTLEIAIGTVESAASRPDFLQLIDHMRSNLNIAANAANGGQITRAAVEDALNDTVYCPSYTLSPEGQKMHDQFMAIWEMAEQSKQWEEKVPDGAVLPENPNFVGQLIKSVEHAQGTRHLLRFARKDLGIEAFLQQLSPALTDALLPLIQIAHDALFSIINAAIETTKKTLNIHALHEINDDRVLRNLRYNESELGHLFAAVRKDSALEQKIARVQRDTAYAIGMSFLDDARGVFRQDDKGAYDARAEDKLRLLEGIYDAYETAIANDRIPPKDEASLGALCYDALTGKLPEGTPNPMVGERLADGKTIAAKAQQREALIA